MRGSVALLPLNILSAAITTVLSNIVKADLQSVWIGTPLAVNRRPLTADQVLFKVACMTPRQLDFMHTADYVHRVGMGWALRMSELRLIGSPPHK